MTSVIGYAVLAIELEDADAAAQLLPDHRAVRGPCAFNGVTSQGPIAAYVGKLASLVGEHDVAEDHLRGALETATAFGWPYHRATTLFALAQARHRQPRSVSTHDAADAGSPRPPSCAAPAASDSWIPQIDELVGDRGRLRDKYIG